MSVGALYQGCLDMAAQKRAARIENRTRARLERLTKFMADAERTRWARQGRRVVFK